MKKKQKFNIIMSIGDNCACAVYMKKHSLRTFSSPFDWLTHADFKTRIELILNDFLDFLNFEDLIPLEKDPSRSTDNKCDYYKNIKNQIYYYHDFKAGISLEKSFPQVKEKYNRRIKRFLNHLNSNKKILLIYLSHQEINNDELIKNYCQKLVEKFNSNLSFLIIEHKDNMEIGKVEELKLAKNIYKYNLYTLATNENQSQVLGQEKYINKIFKNFTLKNPFYKIKSKLVKFVCGLIPSRDLRSKIRKIAKE